MLKQLVVAAVAVSMTGCVTMVSQPAKRPMTNESMQVFASADVRVSENNAGVTKSWFMTDSTAAGASYGVIGAIVTGVMDAIINAGPSRRARKTADEIAEVVPAAGLTDALVASIREAAVTTAGGAVRFGQVSTVQTLLSPDPVKDVVRIDTTYTLSEDASTFRFVATVSLASDKIAYRTPYVFKGKPPESETKGPIYANTFTYQSQQFALPELSASSKEELVESINAAYRDASGALPAPDSKEGKALAKELEQARDEKFSKDEIAVFLAREWVKNNGQRLRGEIDRAHAFLARYLAMDLNLPAVPRFDGEDELLETESDQRTVRRIGKGLMAGAYVSTPGNVDGFTTYGNAISIAKAHQDRIDELEKEARAQKKAAASRKPKT